MTRPAPYEPVKVARMWGVFRISPENRPIAMFRDPDDAEKYASTAPYPCAVGAVDDITGWAWNDIDPPAVRP